MGSPVLPGLWCTSFSVCDQARTQGSKGQSSATKPSQPPCGLKTEQSHLSLSEQLYSIASLFFPWEINPKGHPGREEAQSTLSLLC